MNKEMVEFVKTMPVKDEETRAYLVASIESGMSFQRLLINAYSNNLKAVGRDSVYLVGEFESDLSNITPIRVKEIFEEQSCYFTLINDTIRLEQHEDQLESSDKEEQLEEMVYNLTSLFA